MNTALRLASIYNCGIHYRLSVGAVQTSRVSCTYGARLIRADCRNATIYQTNYWTNTAQASNLHLHYFSSVANFICLDDKLCSTDLEWIRPV